MYSWTLRIQDAVVTEEFLAYLKTHCLGRAFYLFSPFPHCKATENSLWIQDEAIPAVTLLSSCVDPILIHFLNTE